MSKTSKKTGTRADLNAAMRALVGTSEEKLAELREQLFDVIAERQIIGLLARGIESRRIIDFLTIDDFSTQEYSLIFGAFTVLIKQQGYDPASINWLYIADYLRERGSLDLAGGDTRVREILTLSQDETITPIAAMNSLRRKTATRQATSAIVNEVSYYQRANNPKMSDLLDLVAESIDKYKTTINGLITDDSIYSDTLDGSVENLASRITVNAENIIPTPFPTMDRLCRIMKEQLIVFGARPGMGKTSLAVSLAFFAASRGVPTIFLSLEMTERQLLRRHISQTNEITLRDLTGTSTENLIENYGPLIEEYIDRSLRPTIGRLEICDGRLKGVTTPKQLEAYIDVMQSRMGNIGLVVVDHLQLMGADRDHRNNRLSELTEISGALKRISVSKNLCMVALSQLRRVDEKEPKNVKRPAQTDLRESGSIEQDADNIILIHRPEYYWKGRSDTPDDVKGIAELIVDKNRDGATGLATIRWNKNFARFEDPDLDTIPDTRFRSREELRTVRRDPSNPGEDEPEEMRDIV